MQKRRLGKNGPLVHPIGFGAMSFAGFYGPATEAESLATLKTAYDLGVNHWDTALVYGDGLSESIIGKFFRSHPGARDKIVLATKGGIKREPGKTERIVDNSRDTLRRALESSLERLGVSKVDLYYVHRRETARPIEEVTETLARFVEEGLIGGIGFSEIAPTSLRRAHAVHPVMAVQSEYSLWMRMPELGMLQACKELGVAFVPFSPVGRGMLANSAPLPEQLSAGDFRKPTPRFSPENYPRNVRALAPFHAFAAARGVTSAQVALSWVLAQGDHLVPIPGTRTPKHLADNAAAAALHLTPADLAEIDRLLPKGFAHGDRYSESQWNNVERYF